MSKILDATCVDGKVTIEGQEVEAPEILGMGVGESAGAAFISGQKVVYMPKTVEDLQLALEKLIAALTKVADTLTAIGGGMTGPTTAPPPALATNVADINQAITELSELKDNLK